MGEVSTNERWAKRWMFLPRPNSSCTLKAKGITSFGLYVKGGFFAPQSQAATSLKGKKSTKLSYILKHQICSYFFFFHFLFSPISSFMLTSPILLHYSSFLSFNREREMFGRNKEDPRPPTVGLVFLVFPDGSGFFFFFFF
jgi:hypothetical protein